MGTNREWDYETLKAKITKSRSGTVTVANNTRAGMDESGAIHIELHRTVVVVLFPDGRVKLDSGGWRTVTTKTRMNWCLPLGFGVYQERGVWYVFEHGHNNVRPFEDGMIIDTRNKMAAS